MRIATFADIHARGKDLRALRDQLQAASNECLFRRVDLVCIAGDVFDRPSIGDNHASTGAIAQVMLDFVSAIRCKVLMIHGNHDQSGANSVDALRVFKGVPNALIVTEPYGYIHDGSGICVCCVPWSWDSRAGAMETIADLVTAARQQPGIRNVMLLAHVQVAGARMNGSFTCEAKPGRWQVSRGFLEWLQVDHIALGDFHARQDLAHGRGGYVGALRQLNFGEEGNPAGFEIWDTEAGETELEGETEWIELDAAPKHRTVVIDGDQVGGVAPAENELLRIRIDGDASAAWGDQIQALEAEGVKVEMVVEAVERVKRSDVPEGIVNDPHALICLWAENQNPPIDGERLERMLAMFDAIHADAAPAQVEDFAAAEPVFTGTDGAPF